MYEISFAFGSLPGPFHIYTLRPRTRVSQNGTISDIGDPPLVLVVEESDDGPDMETFMSSQEVRLFGVCMHACICSLEDRATHVLNHSFMKCDVHGVKLTISHTLAPNQLFT